MAITMQGSWTVRVRSRNAACAQRLVVEGAELGNGPHDGIVGGRVQVKGAHWTLQVQHRAPRQGWRDSKLRLGVPGVEGGLLRVSIASNDGGLDDDYDDLVLECSLPVSRGEQVVYGEVTSHDGSTPFNPRRDDYLVVDAPVDVRGLCARHPGLTSVIAKLYPQRLSAPAGASVELSPMVIPNGTGGITVGLLFESRPVGADMAQLDDESAAAALQSSVSRVPFPTYAMKAGAQALTHAELEAVAALQDQAIRQPQDVRPEPGLALRFQRYHRNAAEIVGEPYRGTGLREELGVAVTDEQGRYLFRFCRREAEVHPDLIVQVSAVGRPPCFESAPYDRVANLRRIDLCVPRDACSAPARLSRLPTFAAAAGNGVHVAGTHEKRAAEAALSGRRCS